jgi:signal transduction histidine kinase
MLMALLELAHIESGGVQLRHEPLDLRIFTQDLGALFGPQARKKGLEFEVAVEGEGESLVLGDALRLRQVMINLLDNALKFTRQGSIRLRLRLRTAGLATRARFEVEDTGIGFDPVDKERLFQSFEQADGSNTRRFDGSGVGLALCRSIANSMGGEVDANSSPGAGSTFSFTVDLSGDPEARQRAA